MSIKALMAECRYVECHFASWLGASLAIEKDYNIHND
jgi:hypothetical protein